MSDPLAILLAGLSAALIPAVLAAAHYLLAAAREAGKADSYREAATATIAEKNVQLTQQRESCAQEKAALVAEIAWLRTQLDRRGETEGSR